MHDYDVKMLHFTFYGGQKQAVMNFFFFFLDMSAVAKNSTLNEDQAQLSTTSITLSKVALCRYRKDEESYLLFQRKIKTEQFLKILDQFPC